MCPSLCNDRWLGLDSAENCGGSAVAVGAVLGRMSTCKFVRLWPTLAKPTLDKTKFGHAIFGQNQVCPNQLWPNQPFLAKLTRISVLMF